MSALDNIEHFVVLMLENRSFDSLLGILYAKSDDFDGLTGTETNPDAYGAPIQVWNNTGSDEATMRIPDPDPGELWTDINMQLFGQSQMSSPAPVPAMDGFVTNYLAQRNNPIGKNIMHYFTPQQVPVISTLARNFAVCDRWFAWLHARPGRTGGSCTRRPLTATKIITRYICQMWKRFITDLSKRV